MVSQEEVRRRTEAAKEAALARLRHGAREEQAMGRIAQAWERLDVAVDEMARLAQQIERAGQDGDLDLAATFQRDLVIEQARARGMAELLALLMPAPLHTPEAISVEAGARYSAKLAGRPHATPGMRLAAVTVMEDVEGRPVTT